MTREDVVNYFILYLKDRYPELDLRVGTAVRDLVLEPLADLFLELLREFAELKAFLKGESKNEELLEKFLKNFFVERKRGSRATGLVRVYVSKKKPYKVPAGTKFYLSGDKVYITEDEYYFPESKLMYNALEGLYYFEVPAVAEKIGSTYNAKAGTILEPEPFDYYIYKAEAATDFVGGEDVEPIDAFVRRAYKSLTVRNLVSARSISVVLAEKFDNILKIVPIGFGDPEMWRDWSDLVKSHVGGHADVYVKFKEPPLRKVFRSDSDGYLKVPGLIRVLSDVPIYDTDRNESFSEFAWIKTDPDTDVEVLYWPQVAEVNKVLRDSDIRPLTVNFLARCMYPVYISGTVKVRPKPGVSLQSIEVGIKDWIYHTDSFSISDLISVAYNYGADEVETPLILTATVVQPDYSEKV